MEAAPLPIWATNFLPNSYGIGAAAPLPILSSLFESGGTIRHIPGVGSIAATGLTPTRGSVHTFTFAPIHIQTRIPNAYIDDEINIGAIGISMSVQDVTFTETTESTPPYSLAMGTIDIAISVKDIILDTTIVWEPVDETDATWTGVTPTDATWTEV